jgi:predicted Zn-dependent protease
MTGAGVLLARYRIYPEAIKYFQDALAADPDSDDGKYDIADAYFSMRDYGHALQWLQSISPHGRNDPGTMALLGDVDAHLGRLPEAESIFRKAIESTPDDDVYYLSLAMTQLRAGDIAGARQTLSQGQTRIPDSGKLFWGFGVLSVINGNNREAEADFRRALDLMPEWESSYSALGTFYFETGQISSAEQILDRYSQIFPHGSLNVRMLRRVLANASSGEQPPAASLSPQARSQFLQMALILADSNS